MERNYDDDSTKQVSVKSHHAKSCVDYLKENKVMVFIVLLIIAIAIWYFCFRKPDEGNGTARLTVSRQYPSQQ